MDIKICIVVDEGSKPCVDFLKSYNKYVLPKLRKYRITIPIISASSMTQHQYKLLGAHVRRGIFPFAYVGFKKVHEVYVSMDQLIDIIIAKIKASKNDSDRGQYVHRVQTKEDIEMDFIERERRRPDLVAESDKEDDSHVLYGGEGDVQTSKIIAREVPHVRVDPRMKATYSSGADTDFRKKDFDPIEKEFVKSTIDAAQHDIDRFVFETFNDDVFNPDYVGTESRVDAQGVGDRLPSRLSEIMANAR